VHLARGVPLLTVRVKRWARVAAVQVLYYCGLMRMLQAVRLRHRAVVLMYHRVLTEEQRRQTGSHAGIVVTRETFDRQMAFLSRRFTVLSLQEFADRMDRRLPFPNSSCLITFDDGWLDNFENAFPILRAYGLPALVFLPVNFVGSDRRFWRESLTLLLVRVLAEVRREPGRYLEFRAILDRVGLAGLLETKDEDPRSLLSDALEPLKCAAPAVVESLIAQLSSALGTGLDHAGTDRFMNWTQVETMSRQGVMFGGHGAEHRLLSQLPDGEAEAEVAKARDVLQERLAPSIPTFSYPNGSWTPAVAETVQRAGFRLAFTTDTGIVSVADDPYTLRRVNINEDVTRTVPMFAARVLGLF
jgi:peptidoglycan/xylan/chitin deacetylase (PgdA/CDA1 family)